MTTLDSTPARCLICDRVRDTGPDHCDGLHGCDARRVDWRARALAAEARLAEVVDYAAAADAEREALKAEPAAVARDAAIARAVSEEARRRDQTKNAISAIEERDRLAEHLARVSAERLALAETAERVTRERDEARATWRHMVVHTDDPNTRIDWIADEARRVFADDGTAWREWEAVQAAKAKAVAERAETIAENDRLRAERDALRERVRVVEGALVTIERRLREDAAPLAALINDYGTAADCEAWKAVYSSAVHAQGVLNAALAPARDGGAVEAEAAEEPMTLEEADSAHFDSDWELSRD